MGISDTYLSHFRNNPLRDGLLYAVLIAIFLIYTVCGPAVGAGNLEFFCFSVTHCEYMWGGARTAQGQGGVTFQSQFVLTTSRFHRLIVYLVVFAFSLNSISLFAHPYYQVGCYCRAFYGSAMRSGAAEERFSQCKICRPTMRDPGASAAVWTFSEVYCCYLDILRGIQLLFTWPYLGAWGFIIHNTLNIATSKKYVVQIYTTLV